jgi:GNAT superfamily N-acetyltransferase
MTPSALRHATRDDLDALLALYAQLNPDDAPIARERATAILERILASELLAIVVATQDDAVVATCYLNVIPNLTRGGASYAVIENVVVDAARRGTGLGQAVVRFALHDAWHRGCYKALLQTGSRDPRVHRFYEACGFSASEKTGFVARAPGPTSHAQNSPAT